MKYLVTTLCSEGPFRRFYVRKYLLKRSYIQICSECPIFRKSFFMLERLSTLPILAVGYRFHGLSTAYRFYRPILAHFKLSSHKYKNNCKSTPATIKTLKKTPEINGETMARMQEMAHRAHVFKKKIPGPPPSRLTKPSAHPGAAFCGPKCDPA